MTTYPQRPFRWTFTLTSSNNDVEFQDVATTTIEVETIPANDYVTRGEITTPTPADLVDEFQTALQQAYDDTVGGGALFTAALNTGGHIEISHDGASPADDMLIVWGSGSTTLDPGLLGFDPTPLGTTTVSTTVTTSPHQIKNAWYSGAPGDPERDSGKQRRQVYRERRALNGRPARIVHSLNPYTERVLRWDFVMSARIHQERADVAAFAANAGLTTGDTNAAFDNMIAYLMTPAGQGFPDPGEVFYYTTDDPTTHVQEGPFEVALELYLGETAGVTDRFLVDGMSEERYRVELTLFEA